MNKVESIINPLRWLMALLLAAMVAGCGGGDGSPALSSAKAITAYTLAGVAGTINETAKTIAVTVPSGTNVTALVATFTTTGASVKVGTTAQTSATTANNFTSPVTYTVTAADATTAAYTVTVTVASVNAKAITAYTLAGVTGTINQTAKTIAVSVPYGTNITALAAAFTTTGASVKVGTTAQTSGITLNDFTSPVTYTVTAGDSTTATYTVTVTVAQNFAKAITAYSLAGVTGTINETAKTISVTVPSGTNVTALVATFTTTGTSVKVGTTVQTSATSANNFTNPVAYIVTAANTTTATYIVTVVVATGPVPVDLLSILTNNFVILAQTAITDVPASPITGNIGVSAATGASITVPCSDMLTGKVYQVDDAYTDAACSMSGTASGGANKNIVDQAVADMGTAYVDAAGRTVPAPTTELGTGDISGMTLNPGIYKWSSAVLINAGGSPDATGVTLDCLGDANAVFIFQIAQTLTVGSGAKVNLIGSCQAKNIFWQVAGDATLGATSVFNGNILSAAQIIMQGGAVLHGRALAQTQVTMITNTVGP